MIKVIFVGDVFSGVGLKMLKFMLPQYKKDTGYDFCVVNGENTTGGKGLNHADAKALFEIGADVITLGNHVWSKMEIHNYIESEYRVIVPANLPDDLPGFRYAVAVKGDKKLGVISALGNYYMNMAGCPFRAADKLLPEIKEKTKAVIVDFHAEATAEKIAMAHYLNGRVSAVVGTHTHVQTADERILDRGTAVICDAGMTGPHEGVIGSDPETVIKRLLYRYPLSLRPAKGRMQFNGVYLEIDEITGRTEKIERINDIL